MHLLLPGQPALATTIYKILLSPHPLLSSSFSNIHPHQHPTQHYAAFILTSSTPPTTDNMQFTATSLIAMASMSTGEAPDPSFHIHLADNRQLL
jgi:hypothetical protein